MASAASTPALSTPQRVRSTSSTITALAPPPCELPPAYSTLAGEIFRRRKRRTAAVGDQRADLGRWLEDFRPDVDCRLLHRKIMRRRTVLRRIKTRPGAIGGRDDDGVRRLGHGREPLWIFPVRWGPAPLSCTAPCGSGSYSSLLRRRRGRTVTEGCSSQPPTSTWGDGFPPAM
jgi:hypothetical protein